MIMFTTVYLLLSEVTGYIGVQLKYLKGLPSGTARVEVSGHQRNGQVCKLIITAAVICCKNNISSPFEYTKCYL